MKIQRIKNLIHTLKSLNLSTYPKKSIIASLKEFQDKTPTVVATLEPGRIIVRGTPYEEKADFSIISRLSAYFGDTHPALSVISTQSF